MACQDLHRRPQLTQPRRVNRPALLMTPFQSRSLSLITQRLIGLEAPSDPASSPPLSLDLSLARDPHCTQTLLNRPAQPGDPVQALFDAVNGGGGIGSVMLNFRDKSCRECDDSTGISGGNGICGRVECIYILPWST